MQVILDIPQVSLKDILKEGVVRLLLNIIKWCLVILIIALFANDKQFICWSLLGIGVLVLKLLMMTPTFVNYLYCVEVDGDRVTMYYNYFKKIKKVATSISNFKVRSYEKACGVTFFIVEQKQPYKFIIKQCRYGFWIQLESTELLRPYAASLDYIK
ncbi:MAG: hypothetical protein V4613_09575 [Bacteroidota bacterium]